MATQPQRPPAPPQRPAPPQPPRPAAPAPQPHGTVAPPHQPAPPAAPGDQQALKTDLAKAERAPPPPVRTIADEQRERSAEIEKMGVEAYKRSIDQRKDEDKPRPVPGVAEPHPRLEAQAGAHADHRP
jgi:hypothetical protein